MQYEVKENGKQTKTIIFNKYEYLTLYRWKDGNFYETYGMIADTFGAIEPWLNAQGFEHIGFYEMRKNGGKSRAVNMRSY